MEEPLLNGKTILAVDDEPDILTFSKQLSWRRLRLNGSRPGVHTPMRKVPWTVMGKEKSSSRSKDLVTVPPITSFLESRLSR